MDTQYGQCLCGWIGDLKGGEPCPKCQAIRSCYECGERLEPHDIAIMVEVTDADGTSKRGFCLDCAEELSRMAADLEPILPEPEPGNIGDAVDAWLRGSQDGEGGQI